MPGGGLLLGSGVSRRFGSDKRSHVLASGDRLLHATTAIYLQCFEQVVVVLRPGDSELQDALLALVSYTHLRAHETLRHLVCRLLLAKKRFPAIRVGLLFRLWLDTLHILAVE